MLGLVLPLALAPEPLEGTQTQNGQFGPDPRSGVSPNQQNRSN